MLIGAMKPGGWTSAPGNHDGLGVTKRPAAQHHHHVWSHGRRGGVISFFSNRNRLYILIGSVIMVGIWSPCLVVVVFCCVLWCCMGTMIRYAPLM